MLTETVTVYIISVTLIKLGACQIKTCFLINSLIVSSFCKFELIHWQEDTVYFAVETNVNLLTRCGLLNSSHLWTNFPRLSIYLLVKQEENVEFFFHKDPLKVFPG